MELMVRGMGDMGKNGEDRDQQSGSGIQSFETDQGAKLELGTEM